LNCKGCGRKQSWPNPKVLPRIYLEGLRKTTKNLSEDSQSPGRELYPGPPEYEAGVLAIRPRRSVMLCWEVIFVYIKNHTKLINTLLGKIYRGLKLLYVKLGGTQLRLSFK
jgi:hypothetical protein